MKTPRIRRIGEILASIFSRPSVPRSLEDVFTADTARFVARIPVTVPADCALPDCATCRECSAPLDVTAEEQRARDVAAVAFWLRTEMPELWNETEWPVLEEIAGWLLTIRADVAAGKWGRG
jgi:hypothetical protein